MPRYSASSWQLNLADIAYPCICYFPGKHDSCILPQCEIMANELCSDVSPKRCLGTISRGNRLTIHRPVSPWYRRVVAFPQSLGCGNATRVPVAAMVRAESSTITSSGNSIGNSILKRPSENSINCVSSERLNLRTQSCGMQPKVEHFEKLTNW